MSEQKSEINSQKQNSINNNQNSNSNSKDTNEAQKGSNNSSENKNLSLNNNNINNPSKEKIENNNNKNESYEKFIELSDSDSHHSPKKELENKEDFKKKVQEFKNKSNERLIFPKKPEINKTGVPIQISSNFFKFRFKTHSKSFNKYALNINPELPGDAVRIRRIIVRVLKEQIKSIFGEFIFANNVIYSFERITESKILEAKLKNNQNYQIEIKWVSGVESSSTEAMPFYRRFFYKLLSVNKFVCLKRSYFDKNKLHSFENLELWPGFRPTINIFNGEALLNLCTITKVIRNQLAIDVLKNIFSNNQNQDIKLMQLKANELFNNISVFTRYNNDKTFIVKGVDFTKNPNSTFKMKDKEISFYDYFKGRYQYTIKDTKQPMLECIDRKSKRKIYLVPEMCFMTGLTDEMRANRNLMKQVASITTGQAQDKMLECINLVNKIIGESQSEEIINTWGLSIDKDPVSITARGLNCGYLKNQKLIDPRSNNLDREIQGSMFSSPNLNNWMIFYPESFKNDINKFLNYFKSAVRDYKCNIQMPKIFEIHKNINYCDFVRNNIQENTEFVVAIMQGAKGKGRFYNECKILLNSIIGIPNQVILESTLKKGNSMRSIINKILMQINAKRGGQPWVMDSIPLTNEPTMVMSIFNQKDIICGVATYDKLFSKYSTKVAKIEDTLKIGNIVSNIFSYHMSTFYKHWKIAPNRIIIFRDGVNFGDIAKICKNEINSIKSAIREKNSNAKISYILTNKKHNLKVVKQSGEYYSNIPSGTLIDNTVIGDFYEFYLVSQASQMGISQATQYKILCDDNNLKPEDLHSLVYKLCFLYYNWVGAIRIPAPAYYSKKLAALVYDKMRIRGNQHFPNDKMTNLFFI